MQTVKAPSGEFLFLFNCLLDAYPDEPALAVRCL
jgi:hypothetical protein